MTRRHIAALDGVRGLTMLLVVLAHSNQHGLYPIGSWLSFEVGGRYGVFLFFVLSAYLLTRQFLDSGMTRGTLRPQLSEYFFRRFARIYPLYAAAVTAYFLPALVMGQGLYIHTPGQLFESLTLQHGYSIFWTIPVEVAYYFLLPLVALFLLTFTRRPWLAYGGLGVLIAAGALFLPRTYDGGFWPFVFVFLMGSLLAMAVKDLEPLTCGEGRSCRAIRRLADVSAFVALAFVLLLIVEIRAPAALAYYSHPFAFYFDFFQFGLVSCSLILFTLMGGGVARGFFELQPLRFLGKISYSGYLWHMLVLRTYVKLTPIPGSTLNFYICLTLILLLAYGSWYVFEHRLYRSRQLRAGWDYVARLWLSDLLIILLRGTAGRVRSWAAALGLNRKTATLES